ncbi:MAG: FGGY-family carbohydrate kinase [Lachnospiraceae bacterium]
MNDAKDTIVTGNAVLGIELGSTRIKAVLIGENNEPMASGGHEWENSYIDGVWTYDIEEVWAGVQDSYQNMVKDVQKKYGINIRKLKAIGFSGMMHGYMAFGKESKPLVPFRTWRNTITKRAAEELTEMFDYNIPQRWSIAHLYQAVLNEEEHVEKITYITTLAGYIHWKLTGEKILGIGDASGVFPIDMNTHDFNERMIEKFDEKIAPKNFLWKLKDILPKVLVAGEKAGVLTKKGARLLDVTGQLQLGIPFCPPEGDAGTGMVATNSVAKCTGNVSAGTSVFAMIVLERELSKVYPEIDLVTTPSGDLVAMVHCNNCTSDLNAWVRLFKEFAELLGVKMDMTQLFDALYNKALEGDADCGGLLAYNYFSGEHITKFEKGRPLFVRTPDSNFSLANFIRVHLFTSLGALKMGMDILLKQEDVHIKQITGHGGLFKTKNVGQSVLASSMNVPVTVLETAGEGGAWGIALLASYMINKVEKEVLEDYLRKNVFERKRGDKKDPNKLAVKGFDEFMERYTKGLPIERAAVELLL